MNESVVGRRGREGVKEVRYIEGWERGGRGEGGREGVTPRKEEGEWEMWESE